MSIKDDYFGITGLKDIVQEKFTDLQTIEEIFLSDLGVSNNAIRFTSGKDDMDELSSTFGNIKAFMDKLVCVKSLISS